MNAVTETKAEHAVPRTHVTVAQAQLALAQALHEASLIAMAQRPREGLHLTRVELSDMADRFGDILRGGVL